MNSKQFNGLYWNHYIILEEDFRNTLRYVELAEENFKTFSVEFNKQLQSIGSEFDVICKEICKYYEYDNKRRINEYAEVILPKFTNIVNEEIALKGDNDFIIKPLKDWSLTPNHKSPSWWRCYNDVKHNRVNNMGKANMENVLNALASLYLIEMYFIYEIANRDDCIAKIPETPSLLFEIRDWKVNQIMMPGGMLINTIDKD